MCDYLFASTHCPQPTIEGQLYHMHTRVRLLLGKLQPFLAVMERLIDYFVDVLFSG